MEKCTLFCSSWLHPQNWTQAISEHPEKKTETLWFVQRLLLVLPSVRRQRTNVKRSDRVLHLAGSIYHFLCPLVTHAAPCLCYYPVSIALNHLLLLHQPVIYSDSSSVMRPVWSFVGFAVSTSAVCHDALLILIHWIIAESFYLTFFIYICVSFVYIWNQFTSCTYNKATLDMRNQLHASKDEFSTASCSCIPTHCRPLSL